MLGAVAIDSGRVQRVVQGTGPDQVEVQTHPDSSKPVQGLTLPDWKSLTDLCLTGASAFPKLRLQAWDVAMCARGPVLLEMNIGGDFNLPQVANGCGLLDERFRGFLAASTGDDPAAFTPHGAPQGAVGPSPAASRLDVNGGKVSSSGMPGMSCTR